LLSFIDSHCHLSDERVMGDVNAIVSRARQAGVSRVMIGGVDPAEWSRQKILTSRYGDWIRTSFGLHPWRVEQMDPLEVERSLRELASSLSSADALGETGLDFHPRRDPTKYDLQREAFRIQIRMAKQADKPLVLHIVRSHADSIREIDEAGFRGRMLVHSFSGSIEEASEWIQRGALLSFSGGFLIPGKFERARKILQRIPVENLLLETDSPDQAWRPDGINEPACIPELYRGLATLRGGELEFLTQKLDENFRNFG
jgi:TatD DNase family protein